VPIKGYALHSGLEGMGVAVRKRGNENGSGGVEE